MIIRWGETALGCAIGYKQSALAVELVRRGGMYAEDGTLASAVMNGDLMVVEALLSAGKHPDEPIKDPHYQKMTPLMRATNRRHPEIMERLLQAGADKVDLVCERYKAACSLPHHVRGQNGIGIILPISCALAR